MGHGRRIVSGGRSRRKDLLAVAATGRNFYNARAEIEGTHSIPEASPMARPLYLVPLVLLLAPALAHAEAPRPVTVKLTVQAGKLDRANEPVCVPLSLPPGKPAQVQLRKGGKDFVPAQLAPPSLLTLQTKAPAGKERHDLWFVLPSLKAGASLDLEAVVSYGPPPKPERDFYYWFSTGMGWTELRLGERSVLRYVHPRLDESSAAARERTFKVFHHVFDPAGGRVLTNNGPPSKFPHHRGLFYGFMKTTYGDQKVDIWHCTGDTHQAHADFAQLATGEVLGRHRVVIDWNGKGKKTFAREERELTAYNTPGGTLIEFASRLTPTGGKVKLDGDPQHAGFHFRAHNEVATKTFKQTTFIRPDGIDKPGATRNWPAQKSHVNLAWDAMSFVLGEQRYTVAYLDRPSNPKEARFSERDYGRFGSYFVAEATKEKPLVVNYRVWVQRRTMSVAEVAAKSKAFVEPVKVVVK